MDLGRQFDVLDGRQPGVSARADSVDTIVAVATPPGRGGVGVIRVSGAQVGHIAEAVLGALPPPRRAVLRAFRDADGSVLDEGIALYFQSPRSYTGEHVLELHGHGGPVVMNLLVERIVRLGARRARAGEFTERAFLNGKLDLSQAEAVADLIAAGSQQAARSAMRSLQGEFSDRVHAAVGRLTDLRMYVEAAIDFPEEEIDFLSDGEAQRRLAELIADIEALVVTTRQGCLLGEGIDVVIAGAPNVGKSSLLNALAQRDRAIVSPVPGTTRDLLEQSIQIDGLPVQLTDTAGLREADNEIEGEGVRRARAAISRADLVILVVDDTEAPEADDGALAGELPGGADVIVVRNKIDLSGRAPGPVGDGARSELAVSARTGAGLCQLGEALKARAGYLSQGESTFIARRRHVEAIDRARGAIELAARRLREDSAGELVAEELRSAQQFLGEITGAVTSEDLLGRIFGAFCIGK